MLPSPWKPSMIYWWYPNFPICDPFSEKGRRLEVQMIFRFWSSLTWQTQSHFVDRKIPRNFSLNLSAWRQKHGGQAWAIFSIFRLNQSDWWPIISLRLHKSSIYYKSKDFILIIWEFEFLSHINRSIKSSWLKKNRFLRIGQMIIADSEQFRMNSV